MKLLTYDILMWSEQMKQVCEEAKKVCTTVLPDHALVLKMPKGCQLGRFSVEEYDKKENIPVETPCVIWEVDDKYMEKIAQFLIGYEAEETEIDTTKGTMEVTYFVIPADRPFFPAEPEYIKAEIEAYKENDFWDGYGDEIDLAMQEALDKGSQEEHDKFIAEDKQK